MKKYAISIKRPDGTYRNVAQGSIHDAVKIAWEQKAAVRLTRA